MPRKESQYPQDWFRIGEKDLKRAETLLGLGDLEGAGFNIQQAIEKFLKGFLISRGASLRRVHDLETLLNEAVSFEASLERFRDACVKTTEYYVEERYPFVGASSLEPGEVAESLNAAKKLTDRLRSLAVEDG